jgi:hypothetical protein
MISPTIWYVVGWYATPAEKQLRMVWISVTLEIKKIQILKRVIMPTKIINYEYSIILF